MKLFARFRSFISVLFHRSQLGGEIDEEMRAHIHDRANHLERSGLSRAEAERQARLEFGGYQKFKEECRDAVSAHFLETLLQDARYAIRTLRKSPGFTAVAILTLALGIGANSAIFSVVNAVLLRPLAFRDSGRLCLVSEQWQFNSSLGPSYQNYVDFRDQSKSFDAIAAVRNTTFTLTGKGDPERLAAQMDTASMFPMLGVNAVEGHTFLADEDRFGAPSVVLLSYGFWQRHFGGAPGTLGKAIVLDNQSYTIVGIMPPGFQLLQPVDVMVPLTPWAHTLPDDRNWHPGIIAIGRLKSGVNMQQAQAEMSTIAARLDKQYPIYNTGMGVRVSSLHETLVQNVRPALLVLLGAVGLVLLIACSNIANLLLARATSRQREIAIRTALGARHGRILRQLLTESVLLAVLGAVVGLALAWSSMTPLLSLAGGSIPKVGPIRLDIPAIVFTAGIAVLAGILFGLAPAWQTAKLDLRPALNESSRGSTGGSGHLHVRNVLIVTEVALALLLLVSAGLLIRSFARLQNVEPGFQPAHLLVVNVPLSPQAYPKSAQRMDFFDRLIERTRALPGVVSAGAATFLPVSGGGSIIHFNITGRAPKTPGDYILVGYRPISPDYLQTLRVPLLQGRMLTQADTERGPFVVVVNQSMAKQYFPGESALGKRVQLGALPDKSIPTMEIVGIVGDMKQNLATDSQSEMYLPYRQADTMLPVFFVSLVVRTANDPRTEVSALRSVVRNLNSDQPLVNIRTMEENISTSVSEPRFRTLLLGIFAASALLLSVVGLYGLMAYSVSQRVHEIGIRMALGAQPGDVLRMIIGQGLKLVLIGVGLGLAGSLALSRILAQFLYGVTATDPATFIGVAATLILAAVAACYIPARRAMKVDPMVALRYE